MNRKRLGQFLISGVLTACAVVITALIDLVTKSEEGQAAGSEATAEDKSARKG